MDQAIGAIDIYEGTKIRQAGDPAGIGFAFNEAIDHAGFDRVMCFGAGGAFGKDQAVAFAVNLDKANIDLLADHFAPALLGGIACGACPAGETDLGGGYKTAQTSNGDDQ